jgi:hypothetical protein
MHNGSETTLHDIVTHKTSKDQNKAMKGNRTYLKFHNIDMDVVDAGYGLYEDQVCC